MDASLSARVLQRRILLFSALLVLFGGLVVSLTSMMPLVQRNMELRRATFEALLENRQLLVEEFLLRAKDVARSVNSRTRARQLLSAINRGEEGAAGMELKKILQDAHGSISEIGGILWLDNRRQVAAAVGLALPPTEWIVPTDTGAIATQANSEPRAAPVTNRYTRGLLGLGRGRRAIPTNWAEVSTC